MTEIEKKNDAGAQAPKRDATPVKPDHDKNPQDAPNYDRKTDGGRSIPLADMNSANDE